MCGLIQLIKPVSDRERGYEMRSRKQLKNISNHKESSDV